MPVTIKIRKGLDIKLAGEATSAINDIECLYHAIKPIDFVGVFPKLLVSEGDTVKAGTPLFFDKYRDNIIFTAPVSGKVLEIRRGAKRVLLEIIIENDQRNEHENFGTADPASLSREQIIEKLLKSGAWPFLRQRPYGVVADPKSKPKAIFIPAFDSHPLAPDYNFIMAGMEKEFQKGLDVLSKLTDGKVHLNIPGSSASKIFTDAEGVEINTFLGPHPAGNVGTHINRLDPLNRGEIVWYTRPQEVATIGRLFLTGEYHPERIIALTGSEIEKPQYFRTILGPSIKNMVKGNTRSANIRYISGNVLTGRKIMKDGYVGFYDYQLTVVPEGNYYEFFGWAKPGFNKFSFYNQFFSWLKPGKRYRIDTNLHGGHRSHVMTAKFEKVFPFDIYPMQLIKSIMYEDIDEMEALGIYEVEEEDFALCEFIDTSKTDIQALIRKGLDIMRKEMT